MARSEIEKCVDPEAMGSFGIDDTSGVPVWVQIRRRLVHLITSGKYRKDERLPSVRALSVQLGVSYITVNKVYQDLERDGYIYALRGKGSYVADVSAPELSPVEDEVTGLAHDLVCKALEGGMTGEDIVEVVRSELASQLKG